MGAEQKRVEDLEGDELNIAVATEVFGLVPCQAEMHQPGYPHGYPNTNCYAPKDDPTQGSKICDYASNSDEARFLMRVRREWLWCINEEPDGWVRAHISFEEDGHIAGTPGYTCRAHAQHSNDWDRATCVAICRTAIKAVREEK